RPARTPLPSTTLFRSQQFGAGLPDRGGSGGERVGVGGRQVGGGQGAASCECVPPGHGRLQCVSLGRRVGTGRGRSFRAWERAARDRKSTRLNSSHVKI